MKKILSILVIAAMLLAALCVTASAGTFFERNGAGAMSYKDAKFQVKKSYSVVIDGVITPGEYDEFTGHCEWWVGEMASDAYVDAQNLAENVKWYFSWDGNKYFNVAAVFDAGVGATQNYVGGDIFGDYNKKDADPNYVFVPADDFLSWGPAMQIVSNEASAKTPDWARFCFTVGKSDVDGGYISGTYSDQNGQPEAPYAPVGGQDYAVSKNGTVVTIEWKIPVYQLNEKFVEGSATTNFKASITVAAGLFNGTQEIEKSAANYNYGVRLGMLGFNSDSTLEDKGHATFVLTKNEIPGVGPIPSDTTAPVVPGPGDDTTATPDDTTVTPDDTTVTTPDDTTVGTNGTTAGDKKDPAESTTNKTEDNKTPSGNKTPATNNNVATNKPTNNQNAPVTADPMVIAAVVSAISACGVMIAKKRK